MSEFYQTLMGRKFYEADVPRIINSLERIAEALEKQEITEDGEMSQEEEMSHDKTLGIICSYDEQIYTMKEAKDHLDLKSEELEEKIEKVIEERDKQRRVARMQEEMEQPEDSIDHEWENDVRRGR